MTQSKLISVVDDDESIRDSTTTLLRSVGYRVATFESGELFLGSDTLQETECLILDMWMPGMDGFAFVQAVRGSGSPFAQVPILMASGEQQLAELVRARETGADGFLHKPYTGATILAKLEQLGIRTGTAHEQDSGTGRR